MAEFLSANKYILENEGGYANLKGDTGGETYRGISRNNFPNWAGWAIVDASKPLTSNQLIDSVELDSLVNQFYKANFWDRVHGDGVDSQAIATYLYDFYVNAGANAVKCVQRIVGVTVDGGFGNGTLAAVNDHNGDLLKELHDSRCEYYTSLNKPQFIKGWLNRANTMYEKLSA